MIDRHIKLGLSILCVLTSYLLSAQLCTLSDDFEQQTLNPEWQQFQDQYYDIALGSGQLTMTIDPVQCDNNCPWFNAVSAGFIYKTIVGDFELIAAVHAEEATGSNMGDDISNDTQLGGLMARDGSSFTENYVFNVVGTRFDKKSIETKSTTNDRSRPINAFTIPTTRSELRMVRSGSIFTLYSRLIGENSWILRSTFDRPDLPASLQVGIIAYAFQSYPVDLAMKFDYVRYANYTIENHWSGGDGMWSNPAMRSLNKVPDATHKVIIDNPQSQTIQILQNENFQCFSLDVNDNPTNLTIEGTLEVVVNNDGCE